MTKLLNKLHTFESISKDKQLEANIAKVDVLKIQYSQNLSKRDTLIGGKGTSIDGGKPKRTKQ